MNSNEDQLFQGLLLTFVILSTSLPLNTAELD